VEILKIENARKNFGGVKAVDGLSFSVQEGEILGIIGPNGAGKSTVFNLLCGLIPVDAGRIVFLGEDITLLAPHKRCHMGIGRTFQICQPFNELTVLDNVAVAAVFGHSKPVHPGKVKKYSEEVLAKVNLSSKKDLYPAQLTTPDLKLLEIARALATRPGLLLLDEMMAGLLPGECDKILDLIKGINREGITVILVEHVMRVVRALCERVIVMNYGQKLCEGCYEDVTGDERVIEAYLGQEETVAQ
jgi:branched-chain amino acid transport system ATP-binding protein